MLARLAPILSWMIADCLRSNQVWSRGQVQYPKEHERHQSQLHGDVDHDAAVPAVGFARVRGRSIQRRRAAPTRLPEIRSFRSSSPRTERRPLPAPGRSPAGSARPAGGSVAGLIRGACSSLRGSLPQAGRRGRSAEFDRGSSRRSRPFLRTLRWAEPNGTRRPWDFRWFLRRRTDQACAKAPESSPPRIASSGRVRKPTTRRCALEGRHRQDWRPLARSGQPGRATLPQGCWDSYQP